MKVKTWKAWHDPAYSPEWANHEKTHATPSPCRIVPEATWRKVMAVVKAADAAETFGFDGDTDLSLALYDLREHERKRK